MSEAAVAEAPTSQKGGKKDKQSTKPGDPAPKAKKEKVEKILYPALKPDAEGKPTEKLDGWPADFDPKVHKQLKRSHFKNEAPLLRRRAEEMRAKATKLDNEAADCEKGGGKASKSVKKLRSAIERFAELRAELEKDGVDTKEFEEMFKAAMAGKPAPEAEVKAA